MRDHALERATTAREMLLIARVRPRAAAFALGGVVVWCCLSTAWFFFGEPRRGWTALAVAFALYLTGKLVRRASESARRAADVAWERAAAGTSRYTMEERP